MADHENTDEYRVRWNAHTEAITETFSHLYKSKIITDVSLSTEGGIIKAHRVVLSVCSMYFRKLFTSIEDSNPVIVLPNISYDHMQYLMQFMYLGVAQVKSEELKEVLNVAHILQIKGFSTDLRNNAFNPCNREDSHHLLPGFGIIPSINHPIHTPVPSMIPPGLVINPAFSLPNSIPLHNLVSLSSNIASSSLESVFGNPNNSSIRSITRPPLRSQSKKCGYPRKKLSQCEFRVNGNVQQNRLLSYPSHSPCSAKLENIPSFPNSLNATENEPTDLSMPTSNLSSPTDSNEFSSLIMNTNVKEENSSEKTVSSVSNHEEHINIVDLSPNVSPINTNGQALKRTMKRENSHSCESDSSSTSHLDSDPAVTNKRICKNDCGFQDSPGKQESYHEQSSDGTCDAIAGPSWAFSRNRINGETIKYDKQDDTEEEESLHDSEDKKEDFWKDHMKDGILTPYLSGPIPSVPAEPRKYGSSLTAFYPNTCSPASWKNGSVTPPASNIDLPFHLRSNDCEKCGRLYKTRKGLKHHIKNECGVEPRFQCSHCDWRFKQKAHLLRHMARKHTL